MYCVPMMKYLLSVLCCVFLVEGSQQLVYYNVTRAVERGALCNDFTIAGYFIRRNLSSNDWVIFLEGGGGCASVAECNERFIDYRVRPRYSKEVVGETVVDVAKAWNDHKGQESSVTSRLMTSLWAYSPSPGDSGNKWAIEGTDILSSSPKENSVFHSYNHVLIPYCSSDLWLGMSQNYLLARNVSFTFAFQPDSTTNQFTFRGQAIFKSIIHDLVTYHGLTHSQHVVLSGSSAGGLGALNHAQWLNQLVTRFGGRLRTLLDSAWFINFYGNINKRFTEETFNLLGLTDHPQCNNRSHGFPCCLSMSCMLTYGHYPSIPTFTIISVYDLYFLSEALVDVARQEKFFDIIRIVAEYGGEMNHSLTLTSEITEGLSYFVTSCFQHVYLATSTLWGDTGSIYGNALVDGDVRGGIFEHSIQRNRWNSLRLESHSGYTDRTIAKALQLWINEDANKTVVRWRDECSAPHCNDECPEHIVLSTLSALWGAHYNLAISLSVLALSLSCVMVRIILQFCRHRLTRNQKQFIEDLASNPYREETLDLPMNDKAVSVACLNLHYFVYVSKAVLKQAESCRTSARNRLMSIAVMADDTTDPGTPSNAFRRTSVTRVARRMSAMMNHADNSSIDDMDNEQSMLNASQIAATIRDFNKCREQKKTLSKLWEPPDNKKKPIINGISTCFNPGQLIAIMGPSGCGKTTLLDLLTGRRNSGEQKGKIYVNGVPLDKISDWYISNTGYVLQLTAPYYEELTVRENISLAALMRLSHQVSQVERFKRVEQVITETGLTNVADTVVGGNIGQGLSGGQKRRLCVAIQLLKQPSVLFLDEPTSGLDAAASYELLIHLKHVANSNRTVILTIHQPRSEIFNMFHKILVLCQGKVVYSGVPEKAYKVFLKAQKKKHRKPDDFSTKNPADAIMDMLNSENWRRAILQQCSQDHQTQVEVRRALSSTTSYDGHRNAKASSKASFFSRYLSWDMRSAKRESLALSLYLLIIFTVYGLLLGTVYLQTSSGTFILSGFGVFSCASGLFMFPIVISHMGKSLEIFALEYADGVGELHDLIIQTFVRFAAKSCEAIIVSTTLLYLLAVPYSSYDPWVWFQVVTTHLALNQTWISLIIFIITAIPSFAHRIAPIISAIAGFAGGFFVPSSLMPLWYKWLFYINPNYYGFSAIGRVLLSDTEFSCVYDSELECYPYTGIYILTRFDLNNINPHYNILCLLMMTITFLILSYIAMATRYSLSTLSLKGVVKLLTKSKKTMADLDTEANGIELESVTSSSDSEGQTTPTHVSKHAKDHGSSPPLNVKSPPKPRRRARHTLQKYLHTDDVSNGLSDAINNPLPPLASNEASLKPPEVFVCQFDEDYSPDAHASAPKHVTMVPTNFLQVPSTSACSSLVSSKYMTPYSSVSSSLSERSFSSSQESVDLDYNTPITATRKTLLHSRRKSLSENNLTALCRAPSTIAKRRSSSTADNTYQVKIADDIYNLSLPQPLKKKITRYKSYLAVSVSQNMVRNKHGGSTDV